MSDTIEVSGTYTLKAGQNLTFDKGPAFLLLDGETPPRLNLAAKATVDASHGRALGVITDPETVGARGSSVIISDEGVLKVTAIGGYATGVLLGFDQSLLRNDGEVRVSADASNSAEAVVFTGADAQLVNQGLILAFAAHSTVGVNAGSSVSARLDNDGSIQAQAQVDARGVMMGERGRFANAESLDVHAGRLAVGVDAGADSRIYNKGAIDVSAEIAVGISLAEAGKVGNFGHLSVHGEETADAVVVTWDARGVFNTGDIMAEVSSEQSQSRAIVVTTAASHRSIAISNGGVIQADIAIQVDGAARPVFVSNTNLIEGEVHLFDGDDVLINRGEMRGDVSLGAGDDSYSSATGVLRGVVRGEAGEDALEGGDLADRLIGGTGADLLTGGAGADRFIYEALADSQDKARDVITDLNKKDFIDLSAIDADAIAAGDQAFHLVAQFGHNTGELVVSYDAAAQWTLISADVDGDARADLEIIVAGHQQTFHHFVL